MATVFFLSVDTFGLLVLELFLAMVRLLQRLHALFLLVAGVLMLLFQDVLAVALLPSQLLLVRGVLFVGVRLTAILRALAAVAMGLRIDHVIVPLEVLLIRMGLV